ncbi:MAG: hypothetical protein PHS37_02065 [Candidatus Omnitrophica bacterium]|nr:hypothetical protein [Candidatus Omnitrophota bacterium]
MPQPQEQKKKKLTPDEFLKNLSKREKMIGYVAGFFVLLLVLDRLILAPIQDRIKMLDENITQELVTIKDGLMITGYRGKIEDEYKSMTSYFSPERKTQEEELAGFLKDMENLAREMGVNLTTINPTGNIEEAKLYTRYEIKLDCNGTMEALVKYMYAVNAQLKPTKVVSFELLPPAKAATTVRCTMTITRIFVTP